MFYDDIRLLKNHIYANILNSCLKIENISNLENIKLSNKYQTKIYELKGDWLANIGKHPINTR